MKVQKFLLLAAFFIFSFSWSASTTWGSKLSVPFPDGPPDITGPKQYILTIYTFGLSAGALLAFLMIVVGAIQYTVSEAIGSKEDAKDRITSAIWGLVLLLSAFIILNTINPQLPQLQEPTLPAIQLPPPTGGGAPTVPRLSASGLILYWTITPSQGRQIAEFLIERRNPGQFGPGTDIWQEVGRVPGNQTSFRVGGVSPYIPFRVSAIYTDGSQSPASNSVTMPP